MDDDMDDDEPMYGGAQWSPWDEALPIRESRRSEPYNEPSVCEKQTTCKAAKYWHVNCAAVCHGDLTPAEYRDLPQSRRDYLQAVRDGAEKMPKGMTRISRNFQRHDEKGKDYRRRDTWHFHPECFTEIYGYCGHGASSKGKYPVPAWERAEKAAKEEAKAFRIAEKAKRAQEKLVKDEKRRVERVETARLRDIARAEVKEERWRQKMLAQAEKDRVRADEKAEKDRLRAEKKEEKQAERTAKDAAAAEAKAAKDAAKEEAKAAKTAAAAEAKAAKAKAREEERAAKKKTKRKREDDRPVVARPGKKKKVAAVAARPAKKKKVVAAVARKNPAQGDDLLGLSIRRRFEGDFYTGTVDRLDKVKNATTGQVELAYRVTYPDGDKEDLARRTVLAARKAYLAAGGA